MTDLPIVVVDDDSDDLFLYEDAIRKLGISNPLRLFNSGQQGLDYLRTTDEKPFIIISDVNMPKMDGIEFKTIIFQDDYLRVKGIPFVFISTNASADVVKKAHQLSVQGYFEKPYTNNDLLNVLKTLFGYWQISKHINNV